MGIRLFIGAGSKSTQNYISLRQFPNQMFSNKPCKSLAQFLLKGCLEPCGKTIMGYGNKQPIMFPRNNYLEIIMITEI